MVSCFRSLLFGNSFLEPMDEFFDCSPEIPPSSTDAQDFPAPALTKKTNTPITPSVQLMLEHLQSQKINKANKLRSTETLQLRLWNIRNRNRASLVYAAMKMFRMELAYPVSK